MNISLKWSKFKTVDFPCYYADANGNYYLIKRQGPAEYACTISKEGEEALEFDSDYRSTSTALVTDDT